MSATPDKRNRKLTFGVDEAGRGPILGPMAISVVAVDSDTAVYLNELGVADSKKFGAGERARAKRAELADAIRTAAPHHAVVLVDVETVDAYTFEHKLNALERETVDGLLQQLKPSPSDRIICDGARMFAPMQAQYPNLEAVNKGESVHVSVAAASVLAKHARDEAFAEIESRYEAEFGPIGGGGYINKKTTAFLDAYRLAHGGLPPEARKSWGNSRSR